VRQLRVVPSALPDVSGDRRGGVVTAGADRRNAIRAVARCRDRRPVRSLHGDVRAVPWMRAGVSERCSVRPPDRGHQGHTRRLRESGPPAAAAGDEGARSPSPVARRVDAARRRSAPSPRTPTARAGASSTAPRPSWRRRRRHRCVVHWVRHGRLDALDTSRHRHRFDGSRGNGRVVARGRAVLRLAACSRRSARRRQGIRPRRHRRTTRGRAGPGQLGRLRCGDEGVRAPARNSGGGGVLRTRA
jgi:hypothetical protein